MDDDGNGSVLSPGVHKRKAGVEAGIVVVEQEVNSSDGQCTKQSARCLHGVLSSGQISDCL